MGAGIRMTAGLRERCQSSCVISVTYRSHMAETLRGSCESRMQLLHTRELAADAFVSLPGGQRDAQVGSLDRHGSRCALQ